MFQTALNLRVPLLSASESLKSNFYIEQEESSLKAASGQVTASSLGASLSLSALSGLVLVTSGLRTRWLEARYSHTRTPGGPCVAQWSPLSEHSGHSLRSVTSMSVLVNLSTET